MLTFFHGWRRKLGVATLVIACVFMAGWMRSYIIRDVFEFSLRQSQQVLSMNGSVTWFINPQVNAPIRDHIMRIGPIRMRWSTSKTQDFIAMFNGLGLRWHWTLFGLGEGSFDPPFPSDPIRVKFLTIPYLIVVLPLALLSAYLLLSEPRPKKPAKSN